MPAAAAAMGEENQAPRMLGDREVADKIRDIAPHPRWKSLEVPERFVGRPIDAPPLTYRWTR
jgi:hypothetical protein